MTSLWSVPAESPIELNDILLPRCSEFFHAIKLHIVVYIRVSLILLQAKQVIDNSCEMRMEIGEERARLPGYGRQDIHVFYLIEFILDRWPLGLVFIIKSSG